MYRKSFANLGHYFYPREIYGGDSELDAFKSKDLILKINFHEQGVWAGWQASKSLIERLIDFSSNISITA